MSDWIRPLADLMQEDRSDSRPPLDRGSAERLGRRYAEWLRRLEAPPGDMEQMWSGEVRRWPGDVLLHTGKPTVLVAPQGHGKTNAASYLVQTALRLHRDWDVYTNIPYPWFEELRGTVPGPRNLYAVHDAVGLLRGVANTILAGRKPAAVLDESGQWLSSHDWRSDAAESMIKFVYVERHFRMRGPVLVYHTWRTVLEPFRQEGDLRGSYFRVIRARGMYRLARVEDRSAWWGIRESDLPYLTVGQTGFDMNVDFADLGGRLHGSVRTVAQQVLDYLTALEEQRAEEGGAESVEARREHRSALAAKTAGIAELHRVHDERREEIVQAFMEDPDLTNREAQRRFRASPNYLVDCRQAALKRLQTGRAVALSVMQVPA